MEATERFRQLVEGPEEDLPLDEAAFLLAAHARPGLDVAAGLARLDELAGAVPGPGLDGVLDLLFGQLHFAGNAADYYDPDNSFLDQVLLRRTGIPITLSVLTMEVARRVGVTLDGVGMPGHFLVRTRELPPTFVDAFAGGARLDLDACAELFGRTHGDQAAFDVGLLDPVGARAILARMLTNLRVIYEQRGDRPSLAWVLRLRCAIPDAPLSDRRALVAALADIARFGEAADELEAVADRTGARPDAAVRRRAEQLRARLN
jgi:regulator of sirC expression with transglutaminase-like and TPR domain